MSYRIAGMLALSVLLLSACGSDSVKKKLEEEFKTTSYRNMKGLWRSDGYNEVIEIKDRIQKTYQISRGHCFLVSEEPLSQVTRDRPRVFTNVIRDRFYTDASLLIEETHPYYYDRLGRLPRECRDSLTGETDNAVVNFKAFWHSFNDYYAFFSLRNVNWPDIYSEYLLRAERIRDTGEGDLFQLFAEILPQFNDGHVGLIDKEGERFIDSERFTTVQQRVIDEFRRRFSDAVLEQDYMRDPRGATSLSEYILYRQVQYTDELVQDFFVNINGYLREPLRKAANDKVQWGVIDSGNIGYLHIAEMDGFVDGNPTDREQLDALAAALDQAIARLQPTDQLVIDIRFNDGGSDAMSLEIAKRFFDQKRFVFRKRARDRDSFSPWSRISVVQGTAPIYSKPITILTSGITASAAEVFVLSMNVLPNVRLVGERTNGILSDILNVELPNGWMLGLSNEMYEAADGIVYEGRGIPVEQAALLFDPNYRVNQLDAGIEAVLQMRN